MQVDDKHDDFDFGWNSWYDDARPWMRWAAAIGAVLWLGGGLIAGTIGLLHLGHHAWRPKSDAVSIRFNMPRCHKLPDGTIKCSIKKLPEKNL